MAINTFVLVVMIVLFGAMVRTVFGFGEALVTMPLLGLCAIKLTTATALIGVIGLLVAVPAAIRHRGHVDLKILKRLVIGSIFGIPFGIILIKFGNSHLILRGLGIFIALYGLYNLTFIKWLQMISVKKISFRGDYVAGMISGALGSAFNTHGVPVVIYGSLRKWPVGKLKGILQAHFVFIGMLVVISQLSSGMWDRDVLRLLLIIVPLLFIVVPFAEWLASKIKPDKMINYIYVALIIFGSLLVITK